jgi:hypothetical protein
MKRCYHIPTSVSWTDEPVAEESHRLQRVILSVIRRTVENMANGNQGVVAAAAQAQEDISQGFSPDRRHLDRDTYSVPSYQERGASVEVPVETITFGEEEVEPITSTLLLHPSGEVSQDRVITDRSPFEGNLIAIFPHWEAVRVRSERYAVVSELRRAVRRGQFLFGASSFVIIEGPFGRPESRYYVLDTTHALRAPQVVRGSGLQLEGGEVAGIGGRIHWVTEFKDEEGRSYLFRALYTIDDKPLFPLSVELAREFYTQVALSPPERGTIPRGLARAYVFSEIDRLIESGETEAAARKLAELDAHAFALVDWESKAQYLQVLIEAWTLEPQEVAIVELIKSVENRSALLATLGRLRQVGIFDQLFDDLDSQLWSLLVTVGERFGEPGPVTFRFLVELLQQAGLVPHDLESIARSIPIGPMGPIIGTDFLAEQEEAARSFIRFLGGSLEAIWMLISEPEKVVEGIGQLVRMAVMVQLAQFGYPPAVQYVGDILRRMSRKVLYGLKGAQILCITGDILRRIKWAIIWEAASWFIGIGEVKAILSGVGLTRRVTALTRFTRVLRVFGRFANAKRIATKLDDLASLFRSVSLFSSEDDIVRLLVHLPEEDIVRLGRALDSADVSAVQNMAQLAARHPDLAEAANHAIRRAEALSVLEVHVGRLSDNLVQGFQRLSSRSGFSNQALFNLMSEIPAGHAELFMRAVRAMPNRAFGRRVGGRSLGFFQNLANRPRSMHFLIDAGYDTFTTVYRHSGYNIVRFEENLDALTYIARRFPSGHAAVEYRRFMDRLRNSDPAALRELRNARNARRAAAGLPSIRSYTAVELDDIVRTTSDIREIRRLASQMDNSTAGSLFERWVNHYVFHQPVGTSRARLSVRRSGNPHLELQRDRSSDFFIDNDGSLWDAKLYQSGGEIDVYQLDDYRKLEEADFVITTDGRQRNINSIRYIFSDRTAAETNVTLLRVQGGAEAWYIDDHGKLRYLD